MRRTLVTGAGFLTLVVVLLWPGFQAKADPIGPDGCSNNCADRDLFITSAKLFGDPPYMCHLFTPKDCAWCTGGRCKDDGTNPGPEKCVIDKDGNEVVIVKLASGACEQVCTLNTNSFSQAKFIYYEDPVGTWKATQHRCPK
jgi:hypothetical protein